MNPAELWKFITKRNYKKLLLCLLLVSFTAVSAGQNEWRVMSRREMISPWIDNGGKVKGYASLQKNKHDIDNLIFFIDGSEVCPLGESPFTQIDSWMVDHMAVEFFSRCMDEGHLNIFPTNKKSQDFIIKRFIRKKAVRVGGIYFSAKGFTKAYKEYKNKK